MRVKILREKRLKLINDIRAVYAKENTPDYVWTETDAGEITRMEAELATTEELLTRAEADDRLATRLTDLSRGERRGQETRAERGQETRAERRSDRATIGREDFAGETEEREADLPTFRDRAIALQAFFRAGTGEQLTRDQRAACQRLDFNPMVRKIDLAIGDEGFISQLGEVYRDENSRHSKRQTQQLCRERLRDSHEERAMSIVDGAKGGYTVPMEFLNLFDTNMLDFSGVMQVAEIIRTASGGEMPWITMDDTGNEGEFIGENADITGSTEPTLGAQMWYAFKCHAKMIRVPQELIEDNAYNLVGRIGAMLGERLGRIKERKFTLGSGVKCPRGFTLDTTLGVTSASGTAITFDEMIDLQASIDPAYERSARWMMNRGIATHLRKKKDGQGQYLWQAGTREGEPDTILGRGITYNSYLQATVVTATKTVFYGDFSKIKVREVAKLRVIRLDERFAEYDQVAFDALQRVDAKLLKTTTPSVKHLLQA